MQLAVKEANHKVEMEERNDLIRRIRAIERVSTVKPKTYDKSEEPVWGLLDEMSYSELQERMKIIQGQEERKRELKRELILDEHKVQKDKLRVKKR